MIVTAHGKSNREFGEALAASMRAQDLEPRTAVVRAGGAVYEMLNGEGPDREYTKLPGVGWIGLIRDTTLEAWSATVTPKEGA